MTVAAGQYFFQIENRIVDFKAREIGVFAFAVYSVLLRHAGNQDQCRPGMRRIARLLNISENSVKRAIKRLESQRMISVASGKGRGSSNWYDILPFDGVGPTGLPGRPHRATPLGPTELPHDENRGGVGPTELRRIHVLDSSSSSIQVDDLGVPRSSTCTRVVQNADQPHEDEPMPDETIQPDPLPTSQVETPKTQDVPQTDTPTDTPSGEGIGNPKPPISAAPPSPLPPPPDGWRWVYASGRGTFAHLTRDGDAAACGTVTRAMTVEPPSGKAYKPCRQCLRVSGATSRQAKPSVDQPVKDAVAEHLQGIDVGAAGKLTGVLAALAGKYWRGRLARQLTADDYEAVGRSIEAFVQWWSRRWPGITLPTSPSKFESHYAAFANQTKAATPQAAQPAETDEWGQPINPVFPTNDDGGW